MFTYALLVLPVLLIVGLGVAIKRQSAVTRSLSEADKAQDAKVYAESTRVMEATVPGQGSAWSRARPAWSMWR